MIEIGRWPRGIAPLASHIEDLQRKFEMRVLNRYFHFIQPHQIQYAAQLVVLTFHLLTVLIYSSLWMIDATIVFI